MELELPDDSLEVESVSEESAKRSAPASAERVAGDDEPVAPDDGVEGEGDSGVLLAHSTLTFKYPSASGEASPSTPTGSVSMAVLASWSCFSTLNVKV